MLSRMRSFVLKSHVRTVRTTLFGASICAPAGCSSHRNLPRLFSTFVSSHWRADPAAIQSLIDGAGLSVKQTPTHYIVRECPLCQKPHKDKTDNLYKLHIQKASGCFFCHRCGAKGSFFDLKEALGQGAQVTSAASALPGGAVSGGGRISASRSVVADSGGLAAGLIDPAAGVGAARASPGSGSGGNSIAVDPAAALRASRALLDEGRFPAVLNYLTRVRGLSVETLRRYCVGAIARDVPVTASAAAAAAASAGSGATAGSRPPLFDGDFAGLNTGYGGMIAGGLGLGSNGNVRWERHDFVVFPWMTVRQDALPDLLHAQQTANGSSGSRSRIGSGSAGAAHGYGRGSAASTTAPVADLSLPSFGFGSDVELDSIGSDAEAASPASPAWCMPPESALLCNRFKLRSIKDKSVQMLSPRGGGWGMFGWHTLPPHLAGMGTSSSSSSSSASSGGISVHDLGVSVGYRRGGVGGGGRSSSGSSFTSYGVGSVALGGSSSTSSVPTLVLTEGEFDAMSVWQDTGYAAVSLPNGARSMPLELLPRLEPFERILLWMDDDTPGREGAERIAEKLGLGRCHIVRPRPDLIIPRAQRLPPAASASAAGDGAADATAADGAAAAAADSTASQQPSSTSPSASSSSSPSSPSSLQSSISPKDANEFLQRGYELRPLLEAATVRKHDQILSFGQDLRSAVLREVAASLGVKDGPYGGGSANGRAGRHSPSGVPFRSLPRLQRLLKGHRPGELTILCGGTGSGKTTLLSQLSLDLAAQGVRTLWGSFEIKAARLISHMLAQLRSGRIPLPPELAAMMAEQSLHVAGAASGGGKRVPLRANAAAGSVGSAASDGSDHDDVVDVDVDVDVTSHGAMALDAGLHLPPGLGFGFDDGSNLQVPAGLGSASAGPAAAAAVAAAVASLSAHAGGGGATSSSSLSVAQRELAAFERAADALGALPMHFLRFYGATDVDRVLEALEYAYYAHDCEHVILGEY